MRHLLTVPLALVLLTGVADAQDLTFSAEGGTVRAKRGETVVWENHHDRSGMYQGDSAKGKLVGPMAGGTSVFYAIGQAIYRADAATGVVEQRWFLPASAASLAPDVDGAKVTCRSDMWGDKYTWERTYRVGPDSTDLPPFFPAGFTAMGPRRNAESVFNEVAATAGKKPKPSKPDAELMKLSLPALEALAKRHPTNPWYDFVRGEYLMALGQQDAGLAAFDRALSIDPAYHIELLAMVQRLDLHDSARAAKAFDLGLRWLLERGFEPELNQILISIGILYSKPSAETARPQLDPVKDIARLNVLGERLADFCPRAEGVTQAFHSLALANEKARDAADDGAQKANFAEYASRWHALAAVAEPYRVFGGANTYGERAGHAITALLAGLPAFFLVLVIGTLRVASRVKATKDAGLWRLVPFRFWCKLNILGLLVLVGAIGCMFSIAGKGIQAISFSAAMPISTLNGTLSHPDALDYFEPIKASPEGRFIYALALQQAGDLDGAEELYERVPFPQAQVNRGVIAATQGDHRAATELWQQVLERRPHDPVASYNLGEEVDSPRANRRKKYGVKGPMLALPNARMWSEAFVTPSSYVDPFAALSLEEGELSSDAILSQLLGVIIGGISLVAFLCLFLPRLGEEPKGKSLSSMVAWFMSLLLPGTGRVWVLVGPMLLALFLFCALVAWTMSKTGYVNILEAIALPNTSDFFGVPLLDKNWLPALGRRVAAAGSWWIPLLLLNLVAIGVKETRCPDPGGPFAKSDESASQA